MRSTCALVAAVAAACAPLSTSAQTLRYGGEEGHRDRYRLTNTVRVHQEFQGVSTDLVMRSFSLLEVVLQRSEGDTLTYGVTFDSLDLKFEGAPLPAPDLSCVVGETMTLKLSRSGDVHAFGVPADMCPTPPVFDLEQMVSHFFPRLPDEEAKAGTAWTDTLAYPVAQQGIESEVTVVTTYTSGGETDRDGDPYVEVRYGTATTIRGKGEQAGAPLFLDGKGVGEGTILFADDGATFWSSEGTQRLELEVDVTPEGQPPMSIPIRQEVTAAVERIGP